MSLPNGAARPLDDLEVVYMWVDGVYVKAGLEKEKAAVNSGAFRRLKRCSATINIF